MLLTREQILKTDDLPRETVEVPEWGGSVCVRTLTAAERDRFELQFADSKDKGRPRLLRAPLVALTACDETGKPIFSVEDIAALAAKSSAALGRVFDVASKLCGMSKADVEELEKNSEADL